MSITLKASFGVAKLTAKVQMPNWSCKMTTTSFSTDITEKGGPIILPCGAQTLKALALTMPVMAFGLNLQGGNSTYIFDFEQFLERIFVAIV